MTSLRVLRVTLFLMLPTLLVGCGTFAKLVGNDDKGHAIYDRQGLDFLVEDANKKTTIIKDKNSLERFCRSPNPDFAFGETSAVSLGLGRGPSIDTSSGAAIDSLGGRSPALLITRELMYRACELALNLDADVALSREIYWRFLGTIELAIKTQTGTGAQVSTVTTSATASVPAAMPQGNASLMMPGGGSMSPGDPRPMPDGR
jgi:hypothetical protein